MQRGYRIATSVGGTLTPAKGEFIIVDDPLSSSQALSETLRKRATNWFDQTLVSRLNDRKKGVIVLVMPQTPPGRFDRPPSFQTENHMAPYSFTNDI